VRKRQAIPCTGRDRSSAPACDLVAARRASELAVQLQLDDRQRRHRPHVQRIEHVEQRLAQLRQIVVQPSVQARVEEGDALQQPLDVRVLALARLELQAGGDLRIARAELGAEPAQVGQLALVVEQQVVPRRRAHDTPRSSTS
jgi:hypothetical protein